MKGLRSPVNSENDSAENSATLPWYAIFFKNQRYIAINDPPMAPRYTANTFFKRKHNIIGDISTAVS